MFSTRSAPLGAVLALSLVACGGDPGASDADGDGSIASADCNDNNPAIYPGAAEICDGIDNNCNNQADEGFTLNTYYADLDADGYGDSKNSQQGCTTPSGYVTDGSDCNDSSSAIKPGVAEQSCNGIDENCNGLADDHPDLDSDGFDACPTGVAEADNNAVDCNDNLASVNPGALEQCNQQDDNCNGQTDEGLVSATYYQDTDLDGYGNSSVVLQNCTAPAGYVSQGGDCNDGNAAVNPSAVESIGDGIDSDCNGYADGIVLVGGTPNSAGYSGDNGSVGSASFSSPQAISVDQQGVLYIADTENHRIRKITLEGIVTTVAGNGLAGFSGDNGNAVSAQLNGPVGVTADGAGNLYIADTGNHRVRYIVPGGVIRTLAGNGEPGSSGDGGSADAAQLSSPSAVTADPAGNVYIADTGNNKIRKVGVPPTRSISTFAGTGVAGFSGDGGQAVAAQLNEPQGLTIDTGGNVYVADSGNHRIRRVNPLNGKIVTFAGNGTQGYSGDAGPATAASFDTPMALFSRLQEDLYVADTDNHCIRRISVVSGNINTVAGTCTSAGYSGDEGAATAARLRTPFGIVVDSSGYLVLVDTGNEVIRRVIW